MTKQELSNKIEKIEELLLERKQDKIYWDRKIQTEKRDISRFNPLQANLEDTELEIEALEFLRDSIESELKNPF